MQRKSRNLKIVAILGWVLCTLYSGRMFLNSLGESVTFFESVAQLENSNGIVAFRKSNSILWNDVKADQLFCNGDIVSTSNRAVARIQTNSGHIIELQANTMIKLREEDYSEEFRDRRYVLQLIKGKVVAKKGNGVGVGRLSKNAGNKAIDSRLNIDAGDKTFEVTDDPDATLGIAQEELKSTPVIFLSTGKNTVFDKDSKSTADIEPVKVAVTNLNATNFDFSRSNIAFDLGGAPQLAKDLVLPSLALGQSLPKTADEIAKDSHPKVPTPRVKKARIVDRRPAVRLDARKEIQMRYPLPGFRSGSQSYLVTFEKLSTNCELGSYQFKYKINRISHIAEDWQPIVELQVGKETAPESIMLSKSPGVHTLEIPLNRICALSDENKSSTKTIFINTGYVKGDGSIFRNPNKPAKLRITSLFGFSKYIKLTYGPDDVDFSEDQKWLAVESSTTKKSPQNTEIFIPAGTNQPSLIRRLPRQRLIGISFSDQLPERAGVYLVRGSEIVMGFARTLPSKTLIKNNASHLGADHGFAGFPTYLRNLSGAPMNKLSMIETISRDTGRPVTVVARGNIFDMTPKDFEEGSKELLWMASTVSVVYAQKPKRIFLLANY